MITVGVTGGIGSGKTTVCKKWEKLGARVVYADDLAKELMATDEQLKADLTKRFGTNTYRADGSLNRQHLIQEAFEKGRVEELNSIVHPAVARAFRKISYKAEEAGEKMVVEEAALLLNNGRPKELDVIVIVKSDLKNRVRRVVKRDQVSEEKVLSRNSKQPDFNERTHLADYIIENNGTLEELKRKAKDLFVTLLQIESQQS